MMERLFFRKFCDTDFDAVQNYASVAENLLYLPLDPITEEGTRAFISYAAGVEGMFAVCLKDGGQLIGGCNVTKNGELGWLFHRDFWGKGYGTECGFELLRIGFKEMGLSRIVALCDTKNAASYRIMEKIGMRREGTFVGVRRGGGDSHSYAVLKDEWEDHALIRHYNGSPFYFEKFLELGDITDGVVRLVCVNKTAAIPERKRVPSYNFNICIGSEVVGSVGLRIGYTDGLYYGGQIGYDVDEIRRGNGYAGRACLLLLPLAQAHGMKRLLITNNVENKASARVCEKFGARFVKVSRLPVWHDLYQEGARWVNVWELEI